MKSIVSLSHSGVLGVNRTIYRELAKATGAQVFLVVPESWKGDLIEDLKTSSEAGDPSFSLLPFPVRISGNGSLFTYRGLHRNATLPKAPDLLFLDEEPWSLCAFQAYSFFKEAPVKCFFSKQNIHKKLPPPFSWIEQAIYRESSAAFVISEEVGQVLRTKGYQKNLYRLPHSFDPKLFSLASMDSNQKKKGRMQLGIPEDATVIVYAGRLTSEKGVLDLMTTMESILNKPEQDKVCFLWIGSGPLSDSLRSEIHRLRYPERAKLIDAIPHDQFGTILALADILVLPSRTCKNWKEQFGRVLIEAMACGLAVVGSDSGEIPKLIDSTRGGLVFSEGRADQLQQRLEELLDHPNLLASLQKQGYSAVHEKYSHQAVARQWAQDLATIRPN